MSFILEKEGLLRRIIPGGFLLAMLGPWSFDLVGVPAQFACNGLSVRLAGDFCGFPVSVFGGGIMVSINLFRALVRGTPASSLRPELTALVIVLCIFLPFFSSFALIRKKNSRRTLVINIILLVLGGIAALVMLAMQLNRPQVAPVIYLVWGAWLYILVAMSAIVLEVMVLRVNAKPDLAM